MSCCRRGQSSVPLLRLSCDQPSEKVTLTTSSHLNKGYSPLIDSLLYCKLKLPITYCYKNKPQKFLFDAFPNC